MDALLDERSLLPKDWAMAAGFRAAARILTETVENGGADLLVYPITFNFRQYFELTFKRLHYVCNRFESRTSATVVDTLYPTGHVLPTLWKKIRPRIVTCLGPQVEIELAESVDKFVEELHELDPSSEATRYWETLKGGSFLNLAKFNLGEFVNRADDAANLLDGIEATLEPSDLMY